MTRKELENTAIFEGWKSVYIAKRNKSNNLISEVRREITENEILGLLVWYSKKKFNEDKSDQYTVIDNDGNVLLTVKKESNNQIEEL